VVFRRCKNKKSPVGFLEIPPGLGLKINKKWQTEHRTASTAYPCYLPVLGEFSRSWSCRFTGCKYSRQV